MKNSPTPPPPPSPPSSAPSDTAKIMKLFSCTNIVIILFVLYLAITVQQLYYLLNPLAGVEIKGDLIHPLWDEHQSYDIVCYFSSKAKFQEM